MPEKANVVFITCDQWRGDCLGVTGHPVVETPTLDHLASHGAVCTNAYSAVPSCIAARAAILTGLSQTSHGRVGYRDGVPWTYGTTLPGELAGAGYHTQGVGKMHFFPERSLMGFHNVVLHDGYLHHARNFPKGWYGMRDDYCIWLKEQMGSQTADLIEHGVQCNSWVARPWPYDEHLHPTNWVVTQSIDFLRRRDPSGPFFLWMSFVRPHAPLDPPAFYLDMYLDKDMPEPPAGDWATDPVELRKRRRRFDAQEAILSLDELRRARAGYYGCMTHIDHQINRFLEVLGEHEELNNTWIIFTADHGELMGDHYLFRKALPYEGSAGVPFIIRPPGGFDGLDRDTVEEPLELRDILPTILDAAGVPIPDSVEGQSILPLIRGEDTEWRRYIHGEHTYGDRSNHWLTDGKEKYCWFSRNGEEQLFDLIKDPGEVHNLADENTDRLVFWRRRLIEELKDREEGYVRDGELVTGVAASPVLKSVLG